MKTNQLTLPMFPLSMVLLPGETSKLYIFEKRYRQMVDDCIKNKAYFGIAYVEQGKLKDYGCELKITRILKTYDNGSMDIMVECMNLFKLKEFTEVLQPKLYGAATIEYVNNTPKILLNNLQDAVVNYFNTVQNKLIDYETVSRLDLYNVAASLQLNPSEKYRLIAATNQQQYLLNLLNFIVHIITAEQHLKDRVIEN